MKYSRFKDLNLKMDKEEFRKQIGILCCKSLGEAKRNIVNANLESKFDAIEFPEFVRELEVNPISKEFERPSSKDFWRAVAVIRNSIMNVV